MSWQDLRYGSVMKRNRVVITGLGIVAPNGVGTEAFLEALSNKHDDCLVGLDFNYRSTLWGVEKAREIMTPIVEKHVDILITTIEDMAKLYGLGCGQHSADQIINGEMVSA